ncbi:hypothetical protein CY35_02G160200 [Sphagnum magellanicum]|nr:hypothetical protein CY35_02G160200 [Sphagnum magellanicum]
MEKVEKLAIKNVMVVFSESGCCMCLVVKRLFSSLSVSLTVYELDDPKQQSDTATAEGREYDDHDQLLLQLQATTVPSVYVGGNITLKVLGAIFTRLKTIGQVLSLIFTQFENPRF